MTRSGKPPQYKLISHPAVSDDLQALAAYGLDVIAAARAALDDLAHGRVTGKALGERRVSGNLTGLARVKFDAPGNGTQRFRLVYADIDETTRGVPDGRARGVLACGGRTQSERPSLHRFP